MRRPASDQEEEFYKLHVEMQDEAARGVDAHQQAVKEQCMQCCRTAEIQNTADGYANAHAVSALKLLLAIGFCGPPAKLEALRERDHAG